MDQIDQTDQIDQIDQTHPSPYSSPLRGEGR
jgi:hypothetical protein